MDEGKLKHILEAALFVAGEPLSLARLQALFEESPEMDAVRAALAALRDDWQGRGIELVEVASGYRFQVCPKFSGWISRLWEEKPPRYSRALLETLALIAYRQPITRAEIEDIRGVTVSTSIVKTLQEREWIRVVGHRDVPGKPAMYATTRQFLDYFSLRSLDDLPPLAELRDIDRINEELDLRIPQERLGDREPDEDGGRVERPEGAQPSTAESLETESADGGSIPEGGAGGENIPGGGAEAMEADPEAAGHETAESGAVTRSRTR